MSSTLLVAIGAGIAVLTEGVEKLVAFMKKFEEENA